jgi:hypothetical protein
MEEEIVKTAARVISGGRPMLHARIHQGRVETQDPIPAAWEGQGVKILPSRRMIRCRTSKNA